MVFSPNFSSGKDVSSRPDIRLASDASLSGWEGICLFVKTGEPWSSLEVDLHINNLEFVLLAALNALECFVFSVSTCTLEIEVDNTTAASCINCLGSCKSRDLFAIFSEMHVSVKKNYFSDFYVRSGSP